MYTAKRRFHVAFLPLLTRLDEQDKRYPKGVRPAINFPQFVSIMLTFTKAKDRLQKPCTPNILPCRIHRDGPVNASPRYWAPETSKGQSILANSIIISLETDS